MADEFFDDEQELMDQAAGAAEGPAQKTRTSASREARPAKSASGREAPPFWMVLAIAIIALLLGMVIGYLVGSSATLSALESSQAASEEQLASAADDDSYALPEGHPDVTVDEDGTAHVAEDDGANDAA